METAVQENMKPPLKKTLLALKSISTRTQASGLK